MCARFCGSVCAHVCLFEWLGVVNRKKVLFHLSTLPLILFRFSLPLPFTETNGFAIQVSVERGRPFVVNVSACGLAGRWVLGGCEIPSLRISTLASTPGHHTDS